MIAKLRAQNGAIFEFRLKLEEELDSLRRYEDFFILVIRREGFMFKAHITRVYLCDGELVYWGDILEVLNVFASEKKTPAGVEK